jgi:hypothetical protein
VWDALTALLQFCFCSIVIGSVTIGSCCKDMGWPTSYVEVLG